MNASGEQPRHDFVYENEDQKCTSREDRDYIWETVSTIPIEVALADPTLANTAERSLAVISPTQSTIMAARFASGEARLPSYIDIAKELRVTSTTVSNTVAVGRQILQKIIPEIAAGVFDYAGYEDQGRNPRTVLGLMAKTNIPISGASTLAGLKQATRSYVEDTDSISELEKLQLMATYGLTDKTEVERLTKSRLNAIIGKLAGRGFGWNFSFSYGLYEPAVSINQARILAGDKPIEQQYSVIVPAPKPAKEEHTAELPPSRNPVVIDITPARIVTDTNRPTPVATASMDALEIRKGNYNLSKDWRHDALCAEIDDPEIFFPVGSSGPALNAIAESKALCRQCPVVDECLDWAINSGQDYGVWGGMAEDERRDLKRYQQRQITIVA